MYDNVFVLRNTNKILTHGTNQDYIFVTLSFSGQTLGNT